MNGDFLTKAFRKISARIRSDQRSDTDSDDILQDAFCRLWSHRGEIQSERHAEGMLVTASKNLRIDRQRSMSRHPEIGIDEVSEISDQPPAADVVSDTYKRVDMIVRKYISDRDREILYHRDRDGWEYDEIAEMYSLSEANVRMIISRTRKSIRELYRREFKNI